MTMKTNELSSTQSTESKQAWNAPVLTEISLVLDTRASGDTAGDTTGQAS